MYPVTCEPELRDCEHVHMTSASIWNLSNIVMIKKIQALVYWVKDHHKRKLEVDPDIWTEDEVNYAIEQKEAKQNFEKIGVDPIDPGRCQTDTGWDA